jgi:hypothetical protein
MPQIFDIDNDRFVWFTNKLEKLPRSALPKAVKETLNGLAKDLKKTEMPIQAEKEFVNREKNFFKANSSINFASGFDIERMRAETGFFGKSQAVEDLNQQEHGGKIDGRSFIATDVARTSRSKSKKVSKKNQLRSIKNVVRTSSTNPLPKAVAVAGIGNHVLHKGMLFRIENIQGKKFKLLAVYSYKKGRSVSVKATHFMEKATQKTAKKAPEIYKKEAEVQFSRYFSR